MTLTKVSGHHPTGADARFRRNPVAAAATTAAIGSAMIDEMEKISNVIVPNAINEIRTAPVLHKTLCDKTEMKQAVINYLGM